MPPRPSTPLASRLLDLRSTSGLTQLRLARALGVTAPLISSWEKGTVPPPERLDQLAQFFCSPRSLELVPERLIPLGELTDGEEAARQRLADELTRLSREGQAESVPVKATEASFWRFPDDLPITILCTRLSRTQVAGDREVDENLAPIQQYALNPTHPNWIRSLNNGDMDSLLPLVDHIRGRNPDAALNWPTADRIDDAELSGHVIVLGNADPFVDGHPRPSTMDQLIRGLDIPVVVRVRADGDPEFDFEFVVRHGDQEQVFAPEFDMVGEGRAAQRRMERGAPVLQSDVGLLARQPNPNNGAGSITLCTGIFSRGTYGVVRTLTDSRLGKQNEEFLNLTVDVRKFWMLFPITVLNGERTMTPDLGGASKPLWLPS